MKERIKPGQSLEENRFVKVLRKWAVGIGIVFIIVGIIFGMIPDIISKERKYWIAILNFLSLFCSTGGATFLSVALINLIYEKWRDEETENKINSIPDSIKVLLKEPITRISQMEKEINAIPDSVKESIKTSITQISENITSIINPSVPCKIFPPGRQENDPIVEDLKESIKYSDGKYYYTGIEMSTMAKAISELTDKLKEAYFLIPNPSLNRLTDDDKNNMAKSIESLIKVWESSKRIKLEFVFLNYIPPFHIHKTSKDCWFAFLDIGTKVSQQRQKYPATYQYKKDKDKSNDNYEMYHTIAETIDKLYDRHQSGADSERYIFMQGQVIKITKKRSTTASITCQKEGEPLKAIEKDDFIKLFTIPELYE